MKRLRIIPTVLAFMVMVAACADMTSPDVTPRFKHGVDPVGQCPEGYLLVDGLYDKSTDVNGDGWACVADGLPTVDNDVPLRGDGGVRTCEETIEFWARRLAAAQTAVDGIIAGIFNKPGHPAAGALAAASAAKERSKELKAQSKKEIEEACLIVK